MKLLLFLTKEIGIIPFGHSQNLKVAIEELRSKSNFERDVDEQVPSQNPKMEDNCENNNWFTDDAQVESVNEEEELANSKNNYLYTEYVQFENYSKVEELTNGKIY